MALFKTDRRLYITGDLKRVVDEDSPKAAYLLAPAGGEITEQTARRYGLVKALEKSQDKAIAKVANK
jgi:hypothetical protein